MASKPICIRQPGPQRRVGMGRRSRIERCRSQGILHKGKHRPLDNWLNAVPNFRLDDRHPNLLRDFRVTYQTSLKLQPFDCLYSLAGAKGAGDQGIERHQPATMNPLLHQTLGHGLVSFSHRRQQAVRQVWAVGRGKSGGLRHERAG